MSDDNEELTDAERLRIGERVTCSECGDEVIDDGMYDDEGRTIASAMCVELGGLMFCGVACRSDYAARKGGAT